MCYIEYTWGGFSFEEFSDESLYISTIEPWLQTPATRLANNDGSGRVMVCFPGTANVTVQAVEDKDNKNIIKRC